MVNFLSIFKNFDDRAYFLVASTINIVWISLIKEMIKDLESNLDQ